MRLKPIEWVRIDPETGECIHDWVEPNLAPERPRRRPRKRRGPWHWPDGHAHAAATRPQKRPALSGDQMTALMTKALVPPQGVPRGELPAVQVRAPTKKSEIADAQRRSVNYRHVRWDLAGNCLVPRQVVWRSGGHLIGRLPDLDGRFPERTAELYVRCRKCAPCLEVRRRKWASRARRELAAARRTWFVTYTLNDTALDFLRSRAIRHFNERGKAPRSEMVGRDRLVRYWLDPPASFEQLPDEEQFILLEKEMYREFALMMLRLRKTCRETKGQELRYLLVAERKSSGERGERGNPHYHAFIHQTSDADITARMLKAEWRYRRDPVSSYGLGRLASWQELGFVTTKLVQLDAGTPQEYCTKYLAKDVATRVRSSRHYGGGKPLMVQAEPVVLQSSRDAEEGSDTGSRGSTAPTVEPTARAEDRFA